MPSLGNVPSTVIGLLIAAAIWVILFTVILEVLKKASPFRGWACYVIAACASILSVVGVFRLLVAPSGQTSRQDSRDPVGFLLLPYAAMGIAMLVMLVLLHFTKLGRGQRCRTSASKTDFYAVSREEASCERQGLRGQRQHAPEQAVLVYLDGTDLLDCTHQECDLATIEDRLIAAIKQGDLGEFDGNEFGPEGAVLYMYGPDAEKLFAGIVATLRACPLCHGARVVIRHGGPGANQREVRL